MSVRSLARISQSLGPQRTRDELLPFVFEAEDEDEVLTELATQLGNMLAHVGGENYVDHLLSPLEALCATEDVSVRDRAVKSICSLMSNVPGSVHGKFFFPLLQRLAKKEWFAARSSSCGLFAIGYRHANAEAQSEMRKMYASLCADNTPLVRRSATKHIGSFAKTMQASFVQDVMMPLFVRLSKDDQDSVRSVCCYFVKNSLSNYNHTRKSTRSNIGTSGGNRELCGVESFTSECCERKSDSTRCSEIESRSVLESSLECSEKYRKSL